MKYPDSLKNAVFWSRVKQACSVDKKASVYYTVKEGERKDERMPSAV